MIRKATISSINDKIIKVEIFADDVSVLTAYGDEYKVMIYEYDTYNLYNITVCTAGRVTMSTVIEEYEVF